MTEPTTLARREAATMPLTWFGASDHERRRGDATGQNEKETFRSTRATAEEPDDVLCH